MPQPETGDQQKEAGTPECDSAQMQADQKPRPARLVLQRDSVFSEYASLNEFVDESGSKCILLLTKVVSSFVPCSRFLFRSHRALNIGHFGTPHSYYQEITRDSMGARSLIALAMAALSPKA